MNALLPIESIMTRKLVAVMPQDSLELVRDIFDQHNIHHIPVVRYTTILGIVSKLDFLCFVKGMNVADGNDVSETERLKARTVAEIMTSNPTTIDSREPIRNALQVFKQNRFHAIPVLKDGDLVGIVTTHDIIKSWVEKQLTLEDYSEAQDILGGSGTGHAESKQK